MVCKTRCSKSLKYTENIKKIREKLETNICAFIGIATTILLHAIIIHLAYRYSMFIFLGYIPLFLVSFVFAVFLTEGVLDFIFMLILLPGVPVAIFAENRIDAFFDKLLKFPMAA